MKERLEELFKIVKEATEEIEKLRKECKHETSYKGWYSSRPGSVIYGDLCGCCKKFIKADEKQPDFGKA